jgi:hypothetical protein
MENTTAPAFDALKFETVDLGDFTFAEKGEIYTVEFMDLWTEDNGNTMQGKNGMIEPKLRFKEYGTGRRILFSYHYQLVKMFEHNQAETKIVWERNPVFRIERLQDKELKDGTTIANYKVDIAYQN